jgi:hypothetical protein
MPRKKAQPAAEVQPEQTSDEATNQAPRERLQLFIGVNFLAEGASEETRVEAGFVDLGVLPPRFEAELIERKQAKIRLV